MKTVLHNGGPLTGDNIRIALTKLDMVLPMEHLAFEKNGDPLHYRHMVVQIQKEKLVVVYPSDRAAAQPIYPMPSWDQR
jgi:branched-chain amino acid transport system substrate-binding protein